jgi:hypothetical protein
LWCSKFKVNLELLQGPLHTSPLSCVAASAMMQPETCALQLVYYPLCCNSCVASSSKQKKDKTKKGKEIQLATVIPKLDNRCVTLLALVRTLTKQW